MIDPSLKALMNEAVDGTLDESQELELRRRLAAQPEAQAFFDDLVRVRALLDAIPRVDPPACLRAGVMRAVEAEASNHVPAKPRGRWTQWRLLPSGPAPRLRWGHALLFAAGLIVGLLALLGRPGLPGSGQDNGFLTGTLTSPAGHGQAVAVSRQEIALGPVRGHAKVSRTARRLVVDLDLSSAGEADLSVEFDPAGYRLVGFERRDESAGEMVTSAGRVQVTKFAGGQLRIILEEEPSPVHPPLRVIAHRGADVFEQAIEVHGENR